MHYTREMSDPVYRGDTSVTNITKDILLAGHSVTDYI